MAPGTTAWMQRGTEAPWQATGGSREAQVVHRVRTRGRRPTPVHADAREGATWREGLASEEPTG